MKSSSFSFFAKIGAAFFILIANMGCCEVIEQIHCKVLPDDECNFVNYTKNLLVLDSGEVLMVHEGAVIPKDLAPAHPGWLENWRAGETVKLSSVTKDYRWSAFGMSGWGAVTWRVICNEQRGEYVTAWDRFPASYWWAPEPAMEEDTVWKIEDKRIITKGHLGVSVSNAGDWQVGDRLLMIWDGKTVRSPFEMDRLFNARSGELVLKPHVERVLPNHRELPTYKVVATKHKMKTRCCGMLNFPVVAIDNGTVWEHVGEKTHIRVGDEVFFRENGGHGSFEVYRLGSSRAQELWGIIDKLQAAGDSCLPTGQDRTFLVKDLLIEVPTHSDYQKVLSWGEDGVMIAMAEQGDEFVMYNVTRYPAEEGDDFPRPSKDLYVPVRLLSER